MYVTTQGLVLRVTEYNDRDVLLTLLTRDLGRITVKARGARRKNSTLVASCQLLVLSEFTLFEYRDHYVVNDAHVTELFRGLRTDVQKLALATYMAQVVELISQEDSPSSMLQPLVLNCLHALSNMNLPEHKVKAVFELRCACLAGFTPDLSACTYCGKVGAGYFDIMDGCLICNACSAKSASGIRMPVSEGMIAAMQYICTCDHKKIFSFSLNDEALLCLSQVTEAFLVSQLEQGFSALDFYKSLLI